jgi:flagellar biogenesis protein FliO
MSAAETDATPKGARMRAATEESPMFASTSLPVRFANFVVALLGSIKFQRRERSMRLCETLSLGEKRFLAIVQIEQQRFLIAATNQSVALLQRLEGSKGLQSSHEEFAREGGEH